MPTDAMLSVWRERIETALDTALPARSGGSDRLNAAMRYAVLGGGKRLRPLLVYAAGHACGAALSTLDAAAIAVEFIHAYSLAHDDLPAMDDDALRRGRPTVHVAFDEAIAILAGDALQTQAFSVLAAAPVAPDLRLDWIASLGEASGAAGMCGGQALDIDATGNWGQRALSSSVKVHADPSFLAALEQMHALKTGALIRASVRMGARAGSDDRHTLEQLDRFASALGLAFQIRDDILDVEGDSTQLGKTAGKDHAQAKATYPALLGLPGAHAELARLTDVMTDALAGIGAHTGPLAELAALTVQRRH